MRETKDRSTEAARGEKTFQDAANGPLDAKFQAARANSDLRNEQQREKREERREEKEERREKREESREREEKRD